MSSSDHLNYTPRETLKRLAHADVVGVLLPMIDFAVRHPHPFDPIPMLEAELPSFEYISHIGNVIRIPVTYRLVERCRS